MGLKGIDKLREEGLFPLKKTSKPGTCPVLRCGSPSKQIGSCGLCSKHHQQRWRSMSKRQNAFALLKMHAKGRKIEFTLTAEYFAGFTDAFCMFDRQAGSAAGVLTVDRVDASKGYVAGNLQILTRSQNSAKSCRERFLPEHVQAILERKRAETLQNFEELERRMMSAAERDGDPF